MALAAGLFLLLKSSAISAIITHSTPSYLSMCSTILSCIKRACGRPDTSWVDDHWEYELIVLVIEVAKVVLNGQGGSP
jgi:hypothetical protein